MILKSVENGPLIWPTIEENGMIRTKKYVELSIAEKIQAACDMKATNIILQGTSSTKQERECKMYDAFDKFTYIKGETFHKYYLRFTQNFLEPKNTIQDGRVTLQQLQERQGQSYSGTEYKSYATNSRGNNASGQARVVKCYNYQVIPNNAAFQTKDLDTYDSDCDDISNAQAVLMANISIYGFDIISEVPHSETYLIDIENQKKLVLQEQVDSLEQNLFKQIKEKECLLQTFTDFKRESKEKEAKNIENEIDLEKKIKELDNIIFKVGQSALAVHMLTKPQGFYDNIHKQALCYQNPFYLKKAQRIKPTLYDGIVISAKHVVMPVIDDKETLILEEESRSKMAKKDKDPEAIKQKNSNKPIDYVFKEQFDSIKKTRVHSKEQSASLNDKVNLKSTENEDLKAEIQDKVFVITSLKNDLRRIKRKEIVDIAAQKPSANTIVPGMFKLDLEPLAPRLLKNREIHLEYLKNTQEQADILRGIVKQAKAKQPLDNALNFACKHAQRIQELLVYVQDTCPNAIKPSAKKVADTPKNKVKKVIFAEPLTSSSNIKQVESSTTSDSKTPVLSPIGLKCSTSNCGSIPSANKKNDRISQTPSRNMKYKVKAQPNNVNKKNHVAELIRNVDVNQSQLNADFKLICATCKKYMFDGVHDMCILDFVENVNSHAKSAKKHKHHNIWKPMGHVFTKVGFKWKPTGRTFTIVGNSGPLTRITSDNVVPPKKTTSHLVESQNLKLKVYIRKLKNVKNIGSSKKAKIVESKNANHSEPNHSWGSNATNIPSFASLVMIVRFGNDHIVRIIGYGDYQLGNVTISRVDCVKGLRHTLFSVGQFCDADLEVAFRKNTCFIRNLEGVDLISGSRDTNLYNGTEFVNQTLREFYKNVGISHQTSVARTPQQNIIVESSGIGLQCMTPATSSSGLVPNTVSQQPCIPPNKDDWDHLFQPMFDEYFNPPTFVVSLVCVAAAPRAIDLADSPLSTSIDQDALPASIPSTQEQEYSPSISQESPKTPTFHDDPLNEQTHKESTSQGSSSNMRQIHTPFEHLGKWTKDHPIANVIGDPSRSVSTRNQNRRDLPRDNPLDSVEVLRYEKRSKSKNKGKVPNEMELVLEQTQQGTSYEVSISAEGVEELTRKVKTKGEKKEAILTPMQKPGQYICYLESQKMITDIED
uniref:Integrase, catalytic region, zinc finger, CCHC-type, peptidase aspartic, catalytic n=1 Tax=Tanacetum cinerariifolium TaxID=118510 RepID=A0A6L2K0F2_TANCI|nr:integrase, catalytic region, zinc finger, CCHC-type, peptidase aspartic, catalytic [Tanacetum cinerariifolium]